MSQSPASAAPPSNHCPRSEPADGKPWTHPLHSPLPDRGRMQSGLEGWPLELGSPLESWVDDNNISQGFNNIGHEVMHVPLEPSPRVLGTSKGNPHFESHKRKWEGIAENLNVIRGNASSRELEESLPVAPRNINLDSFEGSSSRNEKKVLPDEWSSNKRTRSNDVEIGSVSESKAPGQSPTLSAELWQHIFCFVPPVFLGRLLRVDHAFHTYLTQNKANEQEPKRESYNAVKPLGSEAIWASSRRRFGRGLPKPISGLLELDMWKLLRGRKCQVCGEAKASGLSFSADSPWEAGPGATGLRVVWPWGVRICGHCMQSCSEKEVDLLFSSASALIPALPFAFFSGSNHYIPSITLRSATPPPDLQLAKYYYKPHIEEIKQRLNDARELGTASAEEWIKGLDGEGKERLQEAARWEQWEARGGLRKVNLRPQSKATAIPGLIVKEPNVGKLKDEEFRNGDTKTENFRSDATKSDAHSNLSTPQGMRASTWFSRDSGSPPPSTIAQPPYHASTASAPFHSPWIKPAHYSETLLPHQQLPSQQSRPERNLRDVNEVKANRRAEIERRCAALDPPLLPNVLDHMESFQASIQISQPLNDHAWNLLKPRLLTQRASAEKREKEKSEQSHLLQAEYKQRRQQEAQLKDRKEHMEREWDNMQTPIRNHIAELADQRIEGKWGGGKYVTKENCPQFAADVLLNVRQQFYNEVSHQNKKALLGKNMGIDVTVSSNRILILENMRWLFDTKIKPFTESFQKELFLCHGCDGNFKFYGLESVVQHYAAKHTTTLSCGPQVVSWRAEWPEYPLFHPEPSVAKAASYKVPTPLNGFLQIPPNRDPEILNNFGNFGRTKISSAQPALDMYNASQFPSTTFKDVHAPTYHPRQDGHHSPSKTLNTWHPNFQAPQDTTIHNSNILPSLSTSQASQAFNPQLPHYAYPEFSKAQDHEPKAWHGPDTSEHNSGILTRQSNFSTKPSISSYPPYQVPVGEQSEQTIRSYHFQLEEMAKHTREVWDAISDIKDIPESVRIYVVIQNMVSRFRKTFPQDPSLGMFSDGLNHNALMRPIRTLKGLGCKVCVMNGSGAGRSQQYFAQLPIGDRWLYTLPQLLQHFRVAHVEFPSLPSDTTVGLENLRLDWKFDMIELPETHLVKNLINAPGLDDMKLSLITGVFPGVFPTLKPRIGARDSRDLASGYGAGYYVAGKRQGITAEIYSGSPSISEPVGEAQLPHRPYSAFRELSQPAHSSESPGEDEYDPHRPAVLGKTVPSRTRMTRPRKGFRASPLDTANSSLWCPEDNFSPASLKSIDHSNSYKITSDRRIEGSDQSDHFYKRSDRIQHSVSPQKQTNPLPGVKLSNELPNQFKEHAYEDVNGQDSIDIPSPKHSRVSENDQADDRSTSLGPGKRSVSAQEDATAAEEFLDSLASLSSINHARKSVPSHREESGPMVQPEGTSRDTDRQINSNSALESQGWRADIGSQRSEVDKHVIPIRTGLSKGNEYDEPNLYKTPIFDHEYDTSHRSQSQLHRSSNKSRIGRRSPNTYGTYEAPSRTIIHNRYETNEQIMETPQFRDGSFRTARTSQYRSRSRSPRPIPLGTTYYRARTPTEERRQEPVYHVRSPSLHKDTRPPRVIGYDYPTHDRYEYIDDRRLSDHGLRQRVEFVPVRVEDRQSLEPSRFVLAQPTEMMTQPNYVRLDRAYDVDPVYEHHGQFYHADSRPHHAQQSHGTPTFTQGYRH